MLGLGATLMWGLGIGGAIAGKNALQGGAKGLLSGGFKAARLAGLRAFRDYREVFTAAGDASKQGLKTLVGQGSLNRYPGLVGGLAKAGAAYGAAKGIDSFTDSEWASDISGAGKAALGLASFGLKVGAFRMGVRGAVGTGYAAAERISGESMAGFHSKYDKYLKNSFSSGSGLNLAFKYGVGKPLGFVAKLPLRIPLGAATAAKSAVEAAGKIVGVSSKPWGEIFHPSMAGLVNKLAPKVTTTSRFRIPSSTWTGRGAATDAYTVFSSTTKQKRPWLRKAAQWMTNEQYELPIQHGIFALSAAGGVAANAAAFNQMQKNNWNYNPTPAGYGPWPMSEVVPGLVPGFDPSNYAGIQPAMKSHNPMEVTNLTLGLHRNNRRVMP